MFSSSASINAIFMFGDILYKLMMIKKKAKLVFKHNSFNIIEEGDHVVCAVSGKEIKLKDLNYWNVDLQEAYFLLLKFIKDLKI